MCNIIFIFKMVIAEKDAVVYPANLTADWKEKSQLY